MAFPGHISAMSNRSSSDLPGPSRDRILDFLRWGPRTVEELADQVGLTLNGIRAQLTVLERDGLVARAGLRHAGAAGKPPVLYDLTPAAADSFSTAYGPTLQALVRVMGEHLEGDAFHAMLSETGRRLGLSHKDCDSQEVLEHLGAAVQREPTCGGGERLEGARCPLADAVREEPRTCELVRSMLATATGREVNMQCLHGNSPRCRFDIAG